METRKVYDSFEQKRKINEMKKTINQINDYYKQYKSVLDTGKYSTNEFFRSITSLLRKEVKSLIDKGMDEETALEKILPKAYGIVKLACKEQLGKTYYDVQLMSGIILNESYVAEMATGEGKTITAALPVYLNALLGKGAHVVTPNVYLASRDYHEMKPLYNLLGLSCGLIEELKPTDRLYKIQEKARSFIEDARKNKYYNTQELEELKRQAFFAADKQVIDNDIKKRHQEYLCDVTYGSAHAFAFDYLYDLLEDDPKKLRLRTGKPNYLVIDEADAVLFDDAITSYNISGNQKDSLFAISNQEKNTTISHVKQASQAMNYITSRNDLIEEIPELYDFDKISEQDEYTINNDTPAIYTCKKTKDFHITELGQVIFFKSFCSQQLNQILISNKDRILNMIYQGKHLATNQNGKFALSSRNLGFLIHSNKIPELSKAYDEFLKKDYQYAYQDIHNAIYSWLFLKKDIDYKYTIPSNSENPQYERKISILMDGRVAEGRVYSNGMQQAVEEKEKILNKKRNEPYIIKESEITDTLASIPVAAFFGRYNKFSGMTGTSAKEAFHDLYNLETFTVPRNKGYNVKDHGERLYPTTNDKYSAILNDVIETYRKGQPILLTTTSMGESVNLYNFLINGLRKNGIYVEIPILNANVDVLEKEASIIAQAGRLGAITIATDMAGRGTDIKLGGSNPTKLMEEEVLKKGGLKIIGSGHFKYNRSDRQMKGRTGRQGNVGEIVYYNDPDDLLKIGINPKIVSNFQNMMKRGPIIEEELGSKLITKVIEEAQAKNESISKEIIASNQKFEMPVAACRNKYHDLMERIKSTENYKEVMKKMNSLVIRDIISASSNIPPINGEIKPQGKIYKIDIPMLQDLLREYFGFSIKEEKLNNMNTNEELISLLERVTNNRLEKIEVSKQLIDSYTHRIWHYFEEYVQNIRNQYFVASLVPGGNLPSKIDGQICDAFMYSYHTVFSQIVRDVMHSVRNKENDHFGIYKLQMNSDSTVSIINSKKIDKRDNFISDEDKIRRTK